MMASRNGQSVFDIVREGVWKRRVRDSNGKGTLGMTFGQEVEEEFDIQKSQLIVLKKTEEGRLIIDFGNDE